MTNEIKKFTNEQINWICYQIGEWYLDWKNNIVVSNTNGTQHRLGYAKDELKNMICGDHKEIPIEKTFYVNIYTEGHGYKTHDTLEEAKDSCTASLGILKVTYCEDDLINENEQEDIHRELIIKDNFITGLL